MQHDAQVTACSVRNSRWRGRLFGGSLFRRNIAARSVRNLPRRHAVFLRRRVAHIVLRSRRRARHLTLPRAAAARSSQRSGAQHCCGSRAAFEISPLPDNSAQGSRSDVGRIAPESRNRRVSIGGEVVTSGIGLFSVWGIIRKRPSLRSERIAERRNCVETVQCWLGFFLEVLFSIWVHS